MALKELVDTFNADYTKEIHDELQVGFEGSFGSHHVTPRGLSARLLGKLVCVEGIVSRCMSAPALGRLCVDRMSSGSLIHPKVVRSVHYCPRTEAV